jgi:hypothetical protein
MNVRGLTKAALHGKMLAATLVGAILCTLVPAIATHASSLPDEWDEVFDTARAVLARMPDATRIETIKDPPLREAVLRAYRALKACAKVNKDQSRTIKQGTLAEFERAFKAVQTEAERGEYQTCATKCKSDGAACEENCARKKLCACKMTEFGCFVTRCLFG